MCVKGEENVVEKGRKMCVKGEGNVVEKGRKMWSKKIVFYVHEKGSYTGMYSLFYLLIF